MNELPVVTNDCCEPDRGECECCEGGNCTSGCC
jgi:hypothetical protein